MTLVGIIPAIIFVAFVPIRIFMATIFIDSGKPITYFMTRRPTLLACIIWVIIVSTTKIIAKSTKHLSVQVDTIKGKQRRRRWKWKWKWKKVEKKYRQMRIAEYKKKKKISKMVLRTKQITYSAIYI
jgi:hypothetical protein